MRTYYVIVRGNRELGRHVTADSAGKAKSAFLAEAGAGIQYTALRATLCDGDPEAKRRDHADQAANEFNDRYPVGTPVRYWPGTRDDPPIIGVTRSVAWVIGGHTAVVECTGRGGGIALTHVEVIQR